MTLSTFTTDGSAIDTSERVSAQSVGSENTAEQKPKRRGEGNRNNLQHGMRCVTLGRCPTGASYVGKLTRALRDTLEGLVVDVRGQVTATDSLTIDAACKWERHGLLAMRWLRLHQDDMTLDQRLNFSREIAKAADNRNRAVQALKLDVDTASILDALYSPPKPIVPTEGSECATGI